MSQQPEQNPADGGTPQYGQGQPQQGYPQYQTGQGAPQYGAPAYAGQPQAAGSVDQLLQQKPQQVRTGLLILWISLALTVVLGIIAALTLDFEATYTQQAQVNGQTVDATTVSTMASAARITALVAYILMGAVGALFVWFAGKGRNCAHRPARLRGPLRPGRPREPGDGRPPRQHRDDRLHHRGDPPVPEALLRLVPRGHRRPPGPDGLLSGLPGTARAR